MALTTRIRTAAAIAAVSIGALVPATAHAGLLAPRAVNCGTQTLSQTFLPWADVAYYTLQPGGDFEAGSPAWDLSPGAGIASGNEPWNVTSASDSHSLSLAPGASATSGTICVGIQHPDIRFFANASSSLATLKVEVLYWDGNGNQQALTIGTVTGNSGWAATAQMPIVANLLPLDPDGSTPVAFRLTATSGSWNVDDFYVDPLQRW